MNPVSANATYDLHADRLVESIRDGDFDGGLEHRGVYFLYNEEHELVKIGYGTSLAGRARTVAFGAGAMVTRLLRGCTEHDENLLWHRYVSYRAEDRARAAGLPHPTEWFEACAELREIARLP